MKTCTINTGPFLWRRGRTDLDPQQPGVLRALQRELEHPQSSGAGGAASLSLAAVMPNGDLSEEDEEKN